MLSSTFSISRRKRQTVTILALFTVHSVGALRGNWMARERSVVMATVSSTPISLLPQPKRLKKEHIG